VEALASLKDNMCRVCLQPFHTAVNCPVVREDEAAEYRRHSSGIHATKPIVEEWDLQVARRVLEEADCLFMKFPAEAYRVAAAMQRIDVDDRPAKDFRKAELQLAVKLIHERRVAVCPECNVAGHSLRSCERRAYRALKHVNLLPIDVRLDPYRLRQVLRRYNRDDAIYGELMDALDLYTRGGQLLPTTFLKAIREMDDARIPLAAARYATDTVQSFLLYSNSTDLLQHLRQLRSARFPEVCIFCDSYHHRAEDCARCREEERGYLQELRRLGLTLWTYLPHRDTYDQLLPTDYPRGKESVVGLVDQLEKDYRPGGVGRSRFFKDNDLPDLSQGSLLTNTYASLVDSPSQATLQDRKRPRDEAKEPRDEGGNVGAAALAAAAAVTPASPSDLLGEPEAEDGEGDFTTPADTVDSAQLPEQSDTVPAVAADTSKAEVAEGEASPSTNNAVSDSAHDTSDALPATE
jgi:hypothetical protein